jgi:putative tricarboxylic transport membrane protein
MQRNPVWPSTFPKVLAVLGIIVGLIVLLGLEKPAKEAEPSAVDINWRRLHDYNLGQALMLLGLMVVYALALRPAGFLLATTLFLAGGSVILGERRWFTMILTAVIASVAVWYLVQEVLGIFLRPLPFFMR